jgi:hypothetical protein
LVLLGVLLLQRIVTERFQLTSSVRGQLNRFAMAFVVKETTIACLHLVHVVGHVSAIDELAEGLGIELLGVGIISDKALLAVRNIEATIQCTLKQITLIFAPHAHVYLI